MIWLNVIGIILGIVIYAFINIMVFALCKAAKMGDEHTMVEEAKREVKGCDKTDE